MFVENWFEKNLWSKHEQDREAEGNWEKARKKYVRRQASNAPVR